MSDNARVVALKALDSIVRLGTALAIGLAGWCLVTITKHDSRLAVIEATRFTASDAAVNNNKVMTKLNEMGSDVAVIKTKVDYLAEKK